jgi:zinc protease
MQSRSKRFRLARFSLFSSLLAFASLPNGDVVANAAPPLPPVAAAPSAPGLLFAHEPVVDRLDNGLTVVTLDFPSPGITAYFTLIRAGSRDEVEKGRSGYAHLFEHLMFRGTKNISAEDYEKRLQAMGADNNAFTTDDFTLYIPVVPKDALGELIAVEADRFQHLDVAPAAYKDETGAVLGEYNKDFSDPYLVMDEALREMAFKVHTYGHTTIGYRKDVEAMPNAYDYSKSFFSRYYTPDDATIFVVGDVDREKTLAAIRANYKDWSGHRAKPEIKVEPEQTAPRTKALTWKNPTVPRLQIGYKIPATGSSLRDVAALSVLRALVFDESSPLYQKLVVQDQKVIEIGSDPDDLLHRDPGLFRVDAKLRSGTSFDEIVKAVDDELAKVGRGEVKPELLEAVRSHVLNATTLELQTPGTVAERIAFWTAVTDGDVHAFETYAKAVSDLTLQDVARVAKQYLTPERRNVVTLSPPSSKSATTKSTAKTGAKK